MRTQESEGLMKDKGWECPKCGNVYAPWVPQCSACNKPAVVIVPDPFTSWPELRRHPGVRYPWSDEPMSEVQ